MKLRALIKEKFKTEMAKLKPMSWKQRFEYIIEYYKIHMLFIAVFGLIFYVFCFSLYRQTFDDALYCAMVNNYGYNELNYEYFEDGFHEYGNFGPKDLVTIDTSMNMNYANHPAVLEADPLDQHFDVTMMSNQSDYASTMKLTALVSSKGLDVIIMDSTNMEEFSTQGMVSNIEDVLPADLYASLSDRIVYGTTEEGVEFPCGILLTGTNAQTIGKMTIQDPVFSIIANTERTENCILFLEYLLGK